MNIEQALVNVGSNSRAILATIRRSGKIQLSPIDYTLDTDGLIKIQVTEPAAKTKNARRDPRVSLSILGRNWGEYLVVEGTARFFDGDDFISVLRHVYQRIAGRPHPDWDEFDRAMINEQQVVMAVEIERIYPLNGGRPEAEAN